MSEYPIPEDLSDVLKGLIAPVSVGGGLNSVNCDQVIELIERIARLESENTYRGSLLELALVYLEDCDAWQLRESITKELARAALAEKGLI